MSVYTDARALPGKKGAAGVDERELFMREMSDTLLEAWTETNDFEGFATERTISRGKSDVFPIIGRKRDAAEHVPGELILGGGMEHNEQEITVDKILVDSAFLAEIDELMSNYDLARPYAKQLGESLATTHDKRLAAMYVKAARVATPGYTGGPVGGSVTHANMKTDPAQIENAAYAGVQRINENDIGGGEAKFFLPWQQYLLTARYTGIDAKVTMGSGNRSTGSVGLVAGIRLKPCNHIPKTNIVTGNTKFQGDFTKTVGFIANQQAVGVLNVRGLRMVMKDQPDRLGTLLIASRLNGVGILRGETSFEVAIP